MDCITRESSRLGNKLLSILMLRLPILSWLPKYKLSHIPQDMLAGITVGLTAIPQGIAYAQIAGLQPEYGLYSGFMGCLVYLIFGSCKDVNIGPTAIMALMVQPHTEKLGADLIVLTTFIAGCIIFALGLLHLGFLVEFISYPVTAGFTSAAAFNIAFSQIKGLFGIPGKSNDFLESIKTLLKNYHKATLWDSVLGIGSIVALLLLKQLGKYGSRRNRADWSITRNAVGKFCWFLSLSRNALVVIFGTALAWGLDQNGERPFKLTENVGEGFPHLDLPPFSTNYNGTHYDFLDMTTELGSLIFFLPLVALLESIAISKAFSKGRSLDATQEMIALGLSNILGSFARSMPVTGSFTRTALNNASGVRTTLGGIFTAILVLLALGLLTSTFYYIPKTSLAAVIICAMFFMLKIGTAVKLWRTKKLDFALFATTVIACLATSIEYGFLAGIALNLAVVLWSTARPPLVTLKQKVRNGHLFVVRLSPSLLFPAAEYIREKIFAFQDTLPIVVDGSNVFTIDSTVARNIKVLVEDIKVKDQKLFLWNFNENVKNSCLGLDPSLKDSFYDGDIDDILQDDTNRNVVVTDDNQPELRIRTLS